MNSKLNATNANFALVKTAFHGGGIVGYYNSIPYARRVQKRFCGDCTCGCCVLVPINAEAKKELLKSDPYIVDEDEICLLKDIKAFSPNMHYSEPCL